MATDNLRDELICSLCQDICKEVSSLRCGHSFCQGCIARLLEMHGAAAVYKCPDCKTQPNSSPRRDQTLGDVILCSPSARPGEEVPVTICTYCIHSPVPDIKSCLLCEASLGHDHLKVHTKSAEHVVSNPTPNMDVRRCSIHKKMLESSCAEDAAYLCLYCMAEQREHLVESVDETPMKHELNNILEKLLSSRSEAEDRIQDLKKHGQLLELEAEGLNKKVNVVFKDMRKHMEVLEKKVLSEISRQAEKASAPCQKEIKELEAKKDELSKKMTIIKELCTTSDPITVLNGLEIKKEELPKKMTTIEELSTTSDPITVLNELEIKKEELPKKMTTIEELSTKSDPISVLKDLLVKNVELSKQMPTIEELRITSIPIPGLKGLKQKNIDGGNDQQDYSRAAHDLDQPPVSEILHAGFAELVTIAHNGLFMNEESDIFLDEDTAGNNIRVLPDLKSFYWVETHEPKPKTPQRFKDHQVLSSSSFSTGRHFWMVETSKWGNWRLGMSYPSIARKGFRSYIGCNTKSWGLCKWNNQYSVMHACKEVKLPDKFTCQRFGVYLDYEAGHLSFYELSDPIRHLFSFHATFTKPLHAIFRLWLDSHGGAWMMLKNSGPHVTAWPVGGGRL
ncbi:tripartite motif-containing protein 14-like [Ranitomeya imitator]|uniref:tripartite motif-containing protein 14-like n=1 Tax=Ranitomeya imitator TaxID=111125 RepID=UPI0037E91DB6